MLHLGARGFSGWFDRLSDSQGLNEEAKPRLRRHDLRVSWISALVESGCDVAHVAVQAGDSIETIMATYIKEWRKAAHAEATRAKLEEAMARVVG